MSERGGADGAFVEGAFVWGFGEGWGYCRVLVGSRLGWRNGFVIPVASKVVFVVALDFWIEFSDML